MKKIRPPRLPKPPKLKVFRPRVGAARASGGAGTASDDTGSDDPVYRAPTGSSQDQVGSADQAGPGDQVGAADVFDPIAAGVTQDYRRGGPVKTRADDGGAGDCGGGAGASFPRRKA
jgi:hypothetical protein